MTKTAQSLFDIIFPKQMRIQAGLNDAEASFLYNLWKGAPRGSKMLSLPVSADRKHVNALKTKGYLAGFGDAMELTDKGRKIIVEMVTHEPNAFEKHAKEVLYSGIKSKTANQRPKTAFFNKAAGKEVKAFNLREKRLAEKDHTNFYCNNCQSTTKHRKKGPTGGVCQRCGTEKTKQIKNR